MTFRSGNLYGCPRLSTLAGVWLIDYFDESGRIESVEVAHGDKLEWIKAHPRQVEMMRAKMQAWRVTALWNIP